MITTCTYLGIYEDAIEEAAETAENALKTVGLVTKIEDLHEAARAELESCGNWAEITNSIISAYFSTAAAFIERERPEVNTDYFVNCHDSHFYINREEV